MGRGLDSFGSGKGKVAGCCENRNATFQAALNTGDFLTTGRPNGLSKTFHSMVLVRWSDSTMVPVRNGNTYYLMSNLHSCNIHTITVL
jgi:hypothetical protein